MIVFVRHEHVCFLTIGTRATSRGIQFRAPGATPWYEFSVAIYPMRVEGGTTWYRGSGRCSCGVAVGNRGSDCASSGYVTDRKTKSEVGGRKERLRNAEKLNGGGGAGRFSSLDFGQAIEQPTPGSRAAKRRPRHEKLMPRE
ncbi:hypothetical protein PMIN06_005895 [Paraphaeosphaeria minitans]